MFCFAVMRRYGCGYEDCYEYGLVKAQVHAHVGMFQCDEYAVLSQDAEMNLGRIGGHGEEVITQTFKKAKVGRSEVGLAANTELFIHVWDVIGKDGRWARHDWTVKADPDAVILPWRMRTHLKDSLDQKKYVLNCNAYPTSPFFPMVYGSFEAFSRMAMSAYYNEGGASKCATTLDWELWGEDKYMGECMKLMDAWQATDVSILSDKRCGGSGRCNDGVAAAYHDFKSIDEWFQCWNEAVFPQPSVVKQ